MFPANRPGTSTPPSTDTEMEPPTTRYVRPSFQEANAFVDRLREQIDCIALESLLTALDKGNGTGKPSQAATNMLETFKPRLNVTHYFEPSALTSKQTPCGKEHTTEMILRVSGGYADALLPLARSCKGSPESSEIIDRVSESKALQAGSIDPRQPVDSHGEALGRISGLCSDHTTSFDPAAFRVMLDDDTSGILANIAARGGFTDVPCKLVWQGAREVDTGTSVHSVAE